MRTCTVCDQRVPLDAPETVRDQRNARGHWADCAALELSHFVETPPAPEPPPLEPEVLVFRQVLEGTGDDALVDNAADFFGANVFSEDPANEIIYSRLTELEEFRHADGAFHFRMAYLDIDVEVQWRQTSNPIRTAPRTVTGFAQAPGAPRPDSDFRGLSLTNRGTQLARLSANTDNGSWWWALGARSRWPGGNPSRGLPARRETAETSGIVELYALREVV